MDKVIVYTVQSDAQSLCDKMLSCIGLNDTVYSIPIKKYNENKWFVQILNKDLVHLTAEEFGNLVDFPGGYSDPNEL